jgi:hypothetical protein
MSSKNGFVGMRLDPELIRKIDAMAERESMTRSALIERLFRREFNSVKIVAPMSWLLENFGKLPVTILPEDPPVELLIGSAPEIRTDGALVPRSKKAKD